MVTKNYFFRLFGQSPIKPLQKHMAESVACAAELVVLFESVVEGDRRKVNSVQKRISKMEREADKLKKELRLHLPNSLMLPVSRGDLLELLTMQDRIANTAKDVAGLIVGRKMKFPESMGPMLVEFASRCVDTARQAETTVNELDELVETGFRGKVVEVVQSMLTKLDEIESDTDKMEIKIRATLFDLEKDLPPVDVMFLYKVIEATGDMADVAQRVGSRLQLLLAR